MNESVKKNLSRRDFLKLVELVSLLGISVMTSGCGKEVDLSVESSDEDNQKHLSADEAEERSKELVSIIGIYDIVKGYGDDSLYDDVSWESLKDLSVEDVQSAVDEEKSFGVFDIFNEEKKKSHGSNEKFLNNISEQCKKFINEEGIQYCLDSLFWANKSAICKAFDIDTDKYDHSIKFGWDPRGTEGAPLDAEIYDSDSMKYDSYQLGYGEIYYRILDEIYYIQGKEDKSLSFEDKVDICKKTVDLINEAQEYQVDVSDGHVIHAVEKEKQKTK